MKLSVIVLASGFSRRMGSQNKLFLPLGASDFLSHTLQLALALDCDQRIVVINAEDAAQAVIPPEFQVIINHAPEQGQAHSVVLGTKAALGDAYLFLPIDQPALTVACLQPLLVKADTNRIVYPVVSGKPVNPILFGSLFRQQLLALTGDHGGRIIRNQYPEAQVAVKSQADCFEDIDTMAQYQRFITKQRLK